ncbi:MAG: glutathione S-transferase [Hyphomicrobiales bacterium]|nr:glutathione S-transferase [Hyphomicrobiales bacterium]
MTYELYYWPGIQGRGEFVRLALEEAGADYVDVAREEGTAALMRLWEASDLQTPSFAPPFLRHGDQVIGQTANILLYLGDRHGLVPKSSAARSWTHQIQLTIADLVIEAHDVHHPLGGSFYYEDQRQEARRRSEAFRRERIPRFLGWFESILARNPKGDKFLVGARRLTTDLSLFQVVEGLRYAFPTTMKRAEAGCPRVVALRDRIAERPRIAAYLVSDRRLPFNEEGIFRYYPELEEA